uniref:Uncharacterized protein n=1 Tax=Pseudictyota dubia TaxID=2749911 RepID=A0A7R9VEJ9_9STRA
MLLFCASFLCDNGVAMIASPCRGLSPHQLLWTRLPLVIACDPSAFRRILRSHTSTRPSGHDETIGFMTTSWSMFSVLSGMEASASARCTPSIIAGRRDR